MRKSFSENNLHSLPFRNPGPPAGKSEPAAAGPRVVLYTRRECHLCEEAEALLNERGIQPECIDIDDSPNLRERFNECVPVVEIDGQIRFRGRVDPILLRRLLCRQT
jgi:glutaredoxin